MARLRRLWVGLGGALLFAATAAQASQGAPAAAPSSAPASTVSGVTVTAPEKPNPLVDPTTQFVRQHLPESALSEQYPRFRDAVCVKVQGLPPDFDAFVAKRIVEVATQVHAPVAKRENCVPNVHVIFSTRPQAQMQDIAKRRDILLGFYFDGDQFKRLTAVSHPVEVRYVTRVRDTTGRSYLEIYDPVPWRERPAGRAGSRLGNDMSAEVVHSLILADANKVANEKIGAVADYIAVLALAKWQGLERCNGTPTILNLMAEGCADPPEAATAADLALLTGLYSVDARELGSQQRATIASAIRKAREPDKEPR
jgi:hypothetical protein